MADRDSRRGPDHAGRPASRHAAPHARRAGAHPGQGHPFQPHGGCHADLLPVAGVIADRAPLAADRGLRQHASGRGLADLLRQRSRGPDPGHGPAGAWLPDRARRQVPQRVRPERAGRQGGSPAAGLGRLPDVREANGCLFRLPAHRRHPLRHRRSRLLDRRPGSAGCSVHPEDAVRAAAVPRVHPVRPAQAVPTGASAPARLRRQAADVPPAVGDRERGRQAAVPQGPPPRQAAGHRLRPDPAAGAAGVCRRRGGGGG